MTSFDVLARLRSRSAHPVIATLYTHTLNTPLFVEPARGERLLEAYLRGDADVIYGDAPAQPAASEGSIAIIDVRGALASRPLPGPSGDGPANYETLKGQVAAALGDARVKAIVVRLDSPGGFVSGCFDLTDYIFANRGVKPIVAVVDDMAYSAAFAIAAACSEIWISRTGGVGSVGVVAYHLDQSSFDEKVGVKVTAIYAGKHKNDFTPHAPLSDAAREREQAEVDRLYGMFTELVARYRGMSADAVAATEALTYYGSGAIDIGFADKLGTLEDALDALAAELQRDADQATEISAIDDAQRIAAVYAARRQSACS